MSYTMFWCICVWERKKAVLSFCPQCQVNLQENWLQLGCHFVYCALIFHRRDNKKDMEEHYTHVRPSPSHCPLCEIPAIRLNKVVPTSPSWSLTELNHHLQIFKKYSSWLWQQKFYIQCKQCRLTMPSAIRSIGSIACVVLLGRFLQKQWSK